MMGAATRPRQALARGTRGRKALRQFAQATDEGRGMFPPFPLCRLRVRTIISTGNPRPAWVSARCSRCSPCSHAIRPVRTSHPPPCPFRGAANTEYRPVSLGGRLDFSIPPSWGCQEKNPKTRARKNVPNRPVLQPGRPKIDTPPPTWRGGHQNGCSAQAWQSAPWLGGNRRRGCSGPKAGGRSGRPPHSPSERPGRAKWAQLRQAGRWVTFAGADFPGGPPPPGTLNDV